MAIFGVGAFYGRDDVSQDFIANNIAGIGWRVDEAPELHQFMRSLKVGDIIYIKSFSASSPDIIIRAIGFIKDDTLLDDAATGGLVQAGRNVEWRFVQEFRIPKPQHEHNNVRNNTLYEEYHPIIQAEILSRL